MMMTTRQKALAFATFLAMTLRTSVLLAGPTPSGVPWSAGYRVLLLGADGTPANDMMGSGAFLQYAVSDRCRFELALEYFEYDFESPQRHLGFSNAIPEETDPRTRSTVVSLRVERAWREPTRSLRPFVFEGVGLGYAVVDDIGGTDANGRSFDVRAEGGLETVPTCGVGVRYSHRTWMVDGGFRAEQHFADWTLEDRPSGTRCELGDYAAWGGWVGLSVRL